MTLGGELGPGATVKPSVRSGPLHEVDGVEQLIGGQFLAVLAVSG